MMVAAIALSVSAIGSLLAVDAILNREIERNYRETAPASATLDTERLNQALVAQVKALPGVEDASARRMVDARVELAPGDWRSLLLFVIDENDPLTIARFTVEHGTWPPRPQGIFVERSGLEMLEIRPGSALAVKTPFGEPAGLQVEGVVHDPSLAPSWQERTGYGYVTPDALMYLGDPRPMDELKIVVADTPTSPALIEETAQDVAA